MADLNLDMHVDSVSKKAVDMLADAAVSTMLMHRPCGVLAECTKGYRSNVLTMVSTVPVQPLPRS